MPNGTCVMKNEVSHVRGMTSISDIPVEVIEKIFSFLKGDNVLAGSKVCSLWFFIANSHARKLCFTEIPEDILEEIECEIEEGIENFWLVAYEKWLHDDVSPKGTYSKILSVDVEFTISCMAVDGSYIYMGDTSGNIHILQPQLLEETSGKNQEFSSTRIHLRDGSVHRIALMPYKQLLFATTDSRLQLFKVTEDKHQPVALRTESNIKLCFSKQKVSISRDHFVVAPESQLLSVFKVVEVLSNNEIVLEHICDVETTSRLFLWKIWKFKVICLLTTGEIAIWDISSRAWIYTSVQYSEIRYQNPCWLFRDLIFCSTLTSRSLLDVCADRRQRLGIEDWEGSSYWHMERGTTYWLIGRADGGEPLPQRHTLGDVQPIIPVDEDNDFRHEEDVICVCLQKRLLICGTKSGKLLLHKIPPGFMKDSSYLNFKFRNPFLVLQGSNKPIRFIDIGFYEGSVFIYYKAHNCIIECIMLHKINL